MICRCPKHPKRPPTWQTHTPSPVSVPALSSTAASVTRKMRGLYSRTARKKLTAELVGVHRSFYDRTRRQVRDLSSGPFRILLDIEVRRVSMPPVWRGESRRSDWRSSPTIRSIPNALAHLRGRRCRSATIKTLPRELRLDWDTARNWTSSTCARASSAPARPDRTRIGIDEISIRQGSTYRIVVSDLMRHRPIWFGGGGSLEASMTEFYRFLGEKKVKNSLP